MGVTETLFSCIHMGVQEPSSDKHTYVRVYVCVCVN